MYLGKKQVKVQLQWIAIISFNLLPLLCLSCSNKQNIRRSRAPPLWCSPTPEDGRCAPSCEFPFRHHDKETNVNRFSCLPGPQTAERTEISEAVCRGSDHHRGLLARHTGTENGVGIHLNSVCLGVIGGSYCIFLSFSLCSVCA